MGPVGIGGRLSELAADRQRLLVRLARLGVALLVLVQDAEVV